MQDLNLREIALLTPVAVLMIVLGFAPNPFLQLSEPSAAFLLDTMEEKRAAVLEAEATDVPPTAHAFFDGATFVVEPPPLDDASRTTPRP
jgi:NADH-quinone oxidoreductase subunit M